MLAVLLVTVLLDQITANKEESKKENTPSFCSTFLATFRHLKDVRQCLLIPLTMYSGFEQGFLAGDYTKVGMQVKLLLLYPSFSLLSQLTVIQYIKHMLIRGWISAVKPAVLFLFNF